MLDVRFQPMTDRPARLPSHKGRLADWEARGSLDLLERELRKLGASEIVIESGHQAKDIRNDGWPRSASSPDHHDVRLFFLHPKHGRLRYECNTFRPWEANIKAIALWLQRQRLALEEWGIGSGGEAYRGFKALPPGGGNGTIAAAEWASPEDAVGWLREFIGHKMSTPGLEMATRREMATIGRTPGQLREGAFADLYRQAARKAHPDTGGTAELLAKVTRARDFVASGGTR